MQGSTTDITAHARRLFLVSIGLSAVLAAALGACHLAYDSELALAHGADSIADGVTAAGLMFVLNVSATPPDEEHPFGHQGAQPIAALMVATLTGVLAVGVAREALAALWDGERSWLGWPLAGVIAVKVLTKGIIARMAARLLQQRPSAALEAFRVDARNDALVGLLSLGGFLAARYAELPSLDAWLALPMAVLIGVSGVGLAQESITLLMGSAPPQARQAALKQLAAGVEGVIEVAQLRARYHGHDLHVWLEIRVRPALTVGEAHDIGEAVERRLCAEPDVAWAVAHMDAAGGDGRGSANLR